MKRLVLLALGLWSVSLASYEARARAIENWDVSRLLGASDLVVIASAASNTITAESNTNLWPGCVFHGVESMLTVETVVKGQASTNRITVHHYAFHEGNIPGWCPPELVHLEPGLSFLLFLKRRQDSTYEPTSGQCDPALSVFTLDRTSAMMHALQAPYRTGASAVIEHQGTSDPVKALEATQHAMKLLESKATRLKKEIRERPQQTSPRDGVPAAHDP